MRRLALFLALSLTPALAAAQPPPAQPGPFGQPQPQPQPPGPAQPPPVQPSPPPAQPPPGAWQPTPVYPPPQQQPPPPQQPPPFAWAQPVPPAGAEGEGVETTKGVRRDLPLGRRGAIALDTASVTLASGDLTAIGIDVVTAMPVAKTTFIDVRLPLGWTTDKRTAAVIGNAMLGAHHIVRQRSLWWILGGGFGIPLLSSRTQEDNGFMPLAIPRALWNLHEVSADILPIELDAGLEAHFGLAILRFEIDPVFHFPVGRNDQVELAIQHAVELQIGHAIGGGLRVQGVALPTFEDTGTRSITRGDLYQLAIEPFLTIERRVGFLRAGLMLPLDSFLGPPLVSERNSGGWGLRLGLGLRIE